jgi:hypothetical protein
MKSQKIFISVHFDVPDEPFGFFCPRFSLQEPFRYSLSQGRAPFADTLLPPKSRGSYGVNI